MNQINPKICTHIIFSFFGLDNNGNFNFMGRSESTVVSIFNQLNGLKSQNANLKIMVAVGGWNEGLVTTWSTMAASSSSRNNFAKSALSAMNKFKLDGIGKGDLVSIINFIFGSHRY